MLFTTVQARLSALPDPLPAGPSVLDPVAVATADEAPGWVRRADEPQRDAAVLVLIYPAAEGTARLVLIERPEGDLRHAGQVSFPGGAVEPGDDFPVGTALREAAEEIGLDGAAAGVDVRGVLGTVDVRVSGFLLVPVLALAAREPVLHPDEREVARILHVPIEHFLPQAPIEIVEAERDGWRLRYGAFAVGDHRIWGATARVLGQLGAILGTD
ncbi:MAG: NUDIX hydrolase [Candidatus Limnocylindrales bacterium]